MATIIFRWIAVLPAAILTYVLSWLIYSGIFLDPFEDSQSIVKQIFELVIGLLSGLLTVLAGSSTAPKFKIYVSIVLAIIICMIAATILRDTLNAKRHSETLLIITTIIGALVGCFEVVRTENKDKMDT